MWQFLVGSPWWPIVGVKIDGVKSTARLWRSISRGLIPHANVLATVVHQRENLMAELR